MLLITRRSRKLLNSSFKQNNVQGKNSIIEENEIVSNDENLAQVLNTFFSNIVGSLDIPTYVTSNPISDPIIKLIVKHRKHPSILTIGEVCKERKEKHAAFSFSEVANGRLIQ